MHFLLPSLHHCHSSLWLRWLLKGLLWLWFGLGLWLKCAKWFICVYLSDRETNLRESLWTIEVSFPRHYFWGGWGPETAMTMLVFSVLKWNIRIIWQINHKTTFIYHIDIYNILRRKKWDLAQCTIIAFAFNFARTDDVQRIGLVWWWNDKQISDPMISAITELQLE